jgi:4-nitrotryptophan synthase
MTKPSPLSNPDIVSDPYSVYSVLAEEDPVHWCPELNAWAIMRYSDCLSALNDARLKAERMATVLDVKFPGNELPSDSIYHKFTKNIMMFTDPPLHSALRRSTQAAFTRKAHEYYAEVIERVANELIASLPEAGTEIDAVPALAASLQVMAAIHAFGVPEEDLELVVPEVNTVMSYWSGPKDQPIPLENLLGSLARLHTYSAELVENKRGVVAPNTVIARLVAEKGADVGSTSEQTVHQLVLLLVALFAPTTPGSISSGILSFLANPSQVDRFLADRSCAANVANEVIRYNASNQFTWRIADETIDIAGVRIQKGQLVIPFLGAANRDPNVFNRPNEFDLRRPNSGRHLSFGSGIHSCLGRNIASLEVSAFFAALLRRFPKTRLAGDPKWNSNLEFRSLNSLPVSLG